MSGKLSLQEDNETVENLKASVNIFASHVSKKQSKELYIVPKKPNRCKYKIKSQNLLLILTLAGVFIGIAVGCVVRNVNPSDDTVTLISFPGELFMRMLKMLIVPILFTSVVVGLAKIDYQKSGKIWIHCFSYYICTTVIAATLGILLVSVIQPGNPKTLNINSPNSKFEKKSISTLDSFLDLLRNLIPDNLVASCFQVVQTKITTEENDVILNPSNFSSNLSSISISNLTTNKTTLKKSLVPMPSTNILGLLFFGIVFGVTISSFGKEAKFLSNFFITLNDILMKMIIKALWTSPLGISSLVAGNILKMKSSAFIFQAIGLYMATVMAGLLIHSLITIPIIYFIIIKKNPYKFYWRMLQAVITAFGISSSAGTLPITIKCLEENLGIDKRVTRFVLPLGASMNMDGTALMESVAAITIAQMYNVNLTPGQIVTISITTTLTSIGAAAIPSSGLVALLIVLQAVNLPQEPVGLLYTIDWLLDRFRTVVNVLGDSVGAGIVHHLNQDFLKTKQESKATKLFEDQPLFIQESEQFCDNGLSVLSKRGQENEN